MKKITKTYQSQCHIFFNIIENLVPVVMDSMNSEFEINERDESSTLSDHTIWGDICTAVYTARFTAPVIAAVSVFIAFQLTISPYNDPNLNFRFSRRLDQLESPIPFGLIRPNLSFSELNYVRNITMYAETILIISQSEEGLKEEVINYRFNPSSSNVSHRLPQMFYDGVLFGLTDSNPFNFEYTANQDNANVNLRSDLEDLRPKPSSIFTRLANHHGTGWNEKGFAIYYSYAQLRKHGKLSSDIQHPWKRILDDVLSVARKYKQVYITVWYPHNYGKNGDVSNDFDVILQEIIPCRTGLNDIKSISVVWLS